MTLILRSKRMIDSSHENEQLTVRSLRPAINNLHISLYTSDVTASKLIL